jgi:hypothetical protein
MIDAQRLWLAVLMQAISDLKSATDPQTFETPNVNGQTTDREKKP